MSKTYAEKHGIRAKEQILDEDCWRFMEKTILRLSIIFHGEGKYSLQELDAWCQPRSWRSARGPLKDCVKQGIMEVKLY